MQDRPSERIVDQRLRNRIIEAVLNLAYGKTGVLDVGFAEYFNTFYDWMPAYDEGEVYPNSAMTHDECAALERVRRVVDAACDATPNDMSEEEFIRTGWPARIQPVAREALELMARRGRFAEDREETEPSQRGDWEW